MAISGTYKIGTTEGNMVDVNTPPFSSTYTRKELGFKTDGSPYISLYAEVEWTWNALSQTDYNILYGYWEANSAAVVIRTRIETGNVVTYGNFNVMMHPPASKMDHTFRKTVTVKFTRVEAV